jgi:hypothetical protein
MTASMFHVTNLTPASDSPTWKQPRLSAAAGSAKKSPEDPNGASTSGKAPQNRPKKVFSGEAKHSKPAPVAVRRVWKTSGPTV